MEYVQSYFLFQAFLRMVYHSSQDMLLEVLSVQSAVSSQIAGMLSSGDLKIIVGALQLSELLLQKGRFTYDLHKFWGIFKMHAKKRRFREF